MAFKLKFNIFQNSYILLPEYMLGKTLDQIGQLSLEKTQKLKPIETIHVPVYKLEMAVQSIMSYKDSNIENWPKTWAFTKDDVPYGRKIVEIFVPFINNLKDSKLSRKTINHHIDNLWSLGGFLINEINDDKYQEKEPIALITGFINSNEGPIISDLSEDEQKSFDRTCGKFYKYLTQNHLI